MSTVSRPAKIRENLLDALRLDLVGPEPGLGDNTEVLDRSPSRWYLTGFLVPTEAGEEQKKDEDSDDKLETSSEAGGADDGSEPDNAVVRRASFPSSMCISVLLSNDTESLEVVVRWGDYLQLMPDEKGKYHWRREAHKETVTIEIAHDRLLMIAPALAW